MTAPPRLFTRWRPAESERAAALVIHGYGEHSGRYEHVFAALNDIGCSCLGLDYRGFGRAEGRRAFIRSFADYLDDVAWGLAAMREHTEELPILLGHSQGGLIAALYAIEGRSPLRGLVLSSPALRFAVSVPRWKHALAHALSSVWPTFTLPTELNARDLSHDENKLRQLREDQLAVRVGTARWYTENLRAQERALAGAGALRTPTLLQVAGDDRVVDAAVTRAFYERVSADDKTWIDYPGAYHEVYQETREARAEALKDLCRWIRGLAATNAVTRG